MLQYTSCRRCDQCNQKHCTSLCLTTIFQPTPLPALIASNQLPPPAPIANYLSSGLQATVYPHLHCQFSPNFLVLAQSTHLLKTANAIVSAGSISTKGNIKVCSTPLSLMTLQTDSALRQHIQNNYHYHLSQTL